MFLVTAHEIWGNVDAIWPGWQITQLVFYHGSQDGTNRSITRNPPFCYTPRLRYHASLAGVQQAFVKTGGASCSPGLELLRLLRRDDMVKKYGKAPAAPSFS